MRYLLLILFGTISFTSFGEGLKGRVINAKQATIPFVNILIYVQNNNRPLGGTTTDENGEFTINNLTKGNTLTFSSIGYKTKTWLYDGQDSVNIMLEEETQVLKEVVIKASRYKKMVDRLIIYPNKELRESTNNVWGVLNKLHLPNAIISKESMGITMFDGKSVAYQINGMPATADEYLAILPNQIKSIEFIDNPGVRYATQNFGGILNVKTKEGVKGYGFGFKTMDAVTTLSSENNIFLKLNNVKDQITFIYSNKLRHYTKNRIDTRLVSDPLSLLQIKEGDNSVYSYRQHSLKGVYSHVAKSLLLNVNFNTEFYNNNKDETLQKVYTFNNFISNTALTPTYKSNLYSFDIYAFQKISKKDNLIFDLLTTYRTSNYRYNFMETDQSSMISFNYQYGVRGKRLSFIPELLYEHKINDMNNLSIGVRINYAKTNNNYSQDIMKKDHSDSYDMFSYVQLLGRYKKLSYQIGLGGNIVSYNKDSISYTKRFMRPMIKFSYAPINNLTFSLNTELIPHIPELTDMANITRKLNSIEIEKGNPDLRPYIEYNNRLDVTYNISRLYFQLAYSYRFSRHPFAPNCYIDDCAIYYVTDKYNKSRVHTLSTFLNYEVIKDRLTLSGSCAFSKTLFQKDNLDYSKKIWNYYVEGNLNLTKNWSMNFGIINNRKEFRGNLYLAQEDAVYFSTSYHLKQWMFTAGIWDPFRSKIKLSERNYANSKFTKSIISWNADKANMVYIQVSLSLNKGHKAQTLRQKIHNIDDEDGIVK